MKEILESFVNLLFPPLCIICKEKNINFLCNRCKAKINFIKNNFCARCGTPAEGKITEGAICGKCKTEKTYFVISRSVGVYSDTLKEIIHAFKYNKKKYLAKPLGNLLIEYLIENFNINNIDIVIPIPLHKKREDERGFNQSELLAKEISNKLKIQISNNILFRTKNTLPQFALSPEDRYENIKGAFEIRNGELIKDKNILVVDDICTTGATLKEASKTLAKAKPKGIYCLTLAR